MVMLPCDFLWHEFSASFGGVGFDMDGASSNSFSRHCFGMGEAIFTCGRTVTIISASSDCFFCEVLLLAVFDLLHAFVFVFHIIFRVYNYFLPNFEHLSIDGTLGSLTGFMLCHKFRFSVCAWFFVQGFGEPRGYSIGRFIGCASSFGPAC
jgi:hypothetical protein